MNEQQITHLVMCRFRPGTSDEAIQQVIAGFRDLCGKIEGIVSFEYGENNSPEGKSRGLTHVFNLTFLNVAARDAYLPHPEHRAFGAWARSLGAFDDVLVLDYVAHS